MTSSVTRAVIPAAGLGTRSLPATKAVPKELLPVVDRPAIQYTVAEAVAAGLDDIVIVSSESKPAIEQHFLAAPEFERRLDAAGRTAEADRLRSIGAGAHITVVHQPRPLGLGDAVATARAHVGPHPFAVLLPDQLLPTAPVTLTGLLDVHRATGRAVVALQRVDPAEVVHYGCAAVDDEYADPVTITDLVEKPEPAEAPSTLVLKGRYVCTPEVFDLLDGVGAGVGGERQLSDVLAALAHVDGLRGRVCPEPSFDLGRPLHQLRAIVEVGLDHPELGADFAAALADIARRRGIE
ncbi:MAG: UTP--glucose-1-phosphate uridylyltransferase [Acidimicrobiia bacterium]|nr:UTP--glucose-1-phosphate uridylyltransferase [Acidimicrobiia bacterium]